MQGEATPTGWVKLYTPQSVQLTVPLDLNVEVTSEQAATLLQSAIILHNAGFFVFAHTLEDREQAPIQPLSLSLSEADPAPPPGSTHQKPKYSGVRLVLLTGQVPFWICIAPKGG